MTERRIDVLLEGLAFPESLRWHNDRLWFSDVLDHTVHVVSGPGTSQVVLEVEGQPSGIGWLPDGHLVVVSMHDRQILRLEGRSVKVHADLRPFFDHNANELVVADSGHIYVGTHGFDVDGGDSPAPAPLLCVEPDGTPWVVAEGLQFANGTVITDDGRTLLVAESYGQRITAYDIAADHSLTNPRVWSEVRPNVPDGMCLDADGAVWAADPVSQGVMRVQPGLGAVEWIDTTQPAYGCVLGGTDGRTLFICTSASSEPDRSVQLRSGRIEATKVAVPAAASAVTV